MSVGAHEMPTSQEAMEIEMEKRWLIIPVGQRTVDPYSKEAEGYDMGQIRRHNEAVKRLNDIAQGR